MNRFCLGRPDLQVVPTSRNSLKIVLLPPRAQRGYLVNFTRFGKFRLRAKDVASRARQRGLEFAKHTQVGNDAARERRQAVAPFQRTDNPPLGVTIGQVNQLPCDPGVV